MSAVSQATKSPRSEGQMPFGRNSVLGLLQILVSCRLCAPLSLPDLHGRKLQHRV